MVRQRTYNSAVILLAIIVYGCTSPEPLDNVMVGEYPEAFNYVTSLHRSGSQPEVYDGAGYYIVFDDDARTANITISNLVVAPGQMPLTLSFEGAEMTYTSNNHNTQRMVKADVLVSNDPVNSGMCINDVTIIHSQANELDPYGYSGLFATYSVGNQYQVVSYPYNIFANGTTRIDGPDSATKIDYAPIYRICLKPNSGIAVLTIEGLVIGDTLMPDIIVDGLRLQLDNEGISLSGDGARSCDAPGLDICNLTATTEDLNQLRIRFTLVTEKGEYEVAAFLTLYHTHGKG